MAFRQYASAENGSELNITKRNGLDYIRDHSSCEKLIVVESVRPTITPEVLDRFFEYLNTYEAVACARPITDSLGHYGEWIVDRSEYYTINPPEGFLFPLIEKFFDPESKCTESIQQLPKSTKVYYDFDVPYFYKVTFPEDLAFLEACLKY